MPLSTAASTLHLSHSTPFNPTHQRSFTCEVNPVVLFSILDHYLRRNENQDRVIGTLLGVRSEDGSEVEIRACFNVPHNETAESVCSHALWQTLNRETQHTIAKNFHYFLSFYQGRR